MKKFFTKIMKLFYKYDSRYAIVKNEEFKHDKTIVWSVDHSWNSVEWCLPGLYYLKKNYNFNLVFLAADTEIWQRAHEEENIYAILKNICDVIIINTIDPSNCNWLQRKIYRLRKSLLEEESLKYFFGDIKVDLLLELMSPSCVNQYFLNYHQNTIRVGYEHGTCDKLIVVQSNEKIILPDVDYFFCMDEKIYNIEDEADKNRVIECGVSQFDAWWRILAHKKKLLDLQEKLENKQKRLLVLLPVMLDNSRLWDKDKETLIKALKLFNKKENIILKFHPREKSENRIRFVNDINDDYRHSSIIVTTIATEVISALADCVVVAGVTTSAGAAVVNDVPVIEFHSNKDVDGFFEENGQYGTLLKAKNAIMSAEDYDSLVAAIDGVLYHNAWDMYRGRYKEYINHDNKASQRFAEALIKIMEQ